MYRDSEVWSQESSTLDLVTNQRYLHIVLSYTSSSCINQQQQQSLIWVSHPRRQTYIYFNVHGCGFSLINIMKPFQRSVAICNYHSDTQCSVCE